MISPPDLQIWQDSVNGINDSGKTDLFKEEWSALLVLNESLSSGNFQSDESRMSFTTINECFSMHRNNPALQAHLKNYIDLCFKYGAKLQRLDTPQSSTEPVADPSNGEGTPQANESVALKKLDIKLLIAIILATLVLGMVVFFVIKSGILPGEQTTETGKFTQNFFEINIHDGAKYSDHIDYIKFMDKAYRYNDGKIKIKLSKVPAEKLEPVVSSNSNFKGVGSSDLKANYLLIPTISVFKNGKRAGEIVASNRDKINSNKDIAMMMIMYVDRNCKLKGSFSGIIVNCSLKKGWNRVFFSGSRQEINFKEMTSTQPNGLEWTVKMEELSMSN